MNANYRFIREGFAVKRFHTIGYVAREDTVGSHTVNIIAMLFYIYEGDPPLELIREALYHDIYEVVTGDIPATAKWRFPHLADALLDAEYELNRHYRLCLDLPDDQYNLLKFVDMLELCYKSKEEIAVGNTLFVLVLQAGMRVCSDLLESLRVEYPRAATLFQEITYESE